MTTTDTAAVIAAARDVADNGLGDLTRLAQAVELLAHCHLRTGEEVHALASLMEALIARVDAVEARQVAPVVPIARRPDYTAPEGITLATVVPDDADREWWRTRIVPLTEDES